MKNVVKFCALLTGGYIVFKAGEVSGMVKVVYKITKEASKEL